MKASLYRRLGCLCLIMFFTACQSGGSSTPVPAVKDDSLITQQPCSPPCWQGLIPGQTSYTEASTFMESSPLIQGNVGNRNFVKGAGPSYQHWWWVGESQDVRRQNTFDFDQAGVLDQLYIRPNTDITIEDVIKTYGPPTRISLQPQVPASVFSGMREGIRMAALFEQKNFEVFWFEEMKTSFPTMTFCPSLNTNIAEFRFGTSAKTQSYMDTWPLTNPGIVAGPGNSYVHLKNGQVTLDCVEFK